MFARSERPVALDQPWVEAYSVATSRDVVCGSATVSAIFRRTENWLARVVSMRALTSRLVPVQAEGGWPAAPWLRLLAVRGLVVAACVLVPLGTRVTWEGRAALERAREAEAAGTFDVAVLHYREAARWYLPGAPWVAGSLGALRRLAEARERMGDTDAALFAWRALRGAILATRSFYTPHARTLAAANARIASLMASLPAPGVDAGKSLPTLEAEHRALLEQSHRAQPIWGLLATAAWGLMAWLLYRAAVTGRRRGRYLLGALGAATLYVIGLLLA